MLTLYNYNFYDIISPFRQLDSPAPSQMGSTSTPQYDGGDRTGHCRAGAAWARWRRGAAPCLAGRTMEGVVWGDAGRRPGSRRARRMATGVSSRGASRLSTTTRGGCRPASEDGGLEAVTVSRMCSAFSAGVFWSQATADAWATRCMELQYSSKLPATMGCRSVSSSVQCGSIAQVCDPSGGSSVVPIKLGFGNPQV